MGPRNGDGLGDISADASLGAGLTDSCATCHGRSRGSAGFGGDVFTRPDSRDAPHLFGLGIIEMLADEITQDLRQIRDRAIARAREGQRSVEVLLKSKDISYGRIRVNPDGSVDPFELEGVDEDLGRFAGTRNLFRLDRSRAPRQCRPNPCGSARAK
jgi:hypothetical protein